MSDPLKAYFDAGQAPAEDTAFRLALMERVAKRRFQIELGLEIVFFAALALCLALLWPALNATLLSVGGSMTGIAAMVTVLGAIALAGQWAATHRLRLPLPRWMG